MIILQLRTWIVEGVCENDDVLLVVSCALGMI
jgi:hypothetical protein